MKITYRDKEWELEGRWRVRDAIKKVGIIPQTVLAVRDGKLLTGAPAWVPSEGVTAQ